MTQDSPIDSRLIEFAFLWPSRDAVATPVVTVATPIFFRGLAIKAIKGLALFVMESRIESDRTAR